MLCSCTILLTLIFHHATRMIKTSSIQMIHTDTFIKEQPQAKTSGTPAFGDSPDAPWLPILVLHIRSQVKTRQRHSYKLKQNNKNPNYKTLQETSHATHLLVLRDPIYKYETDPTRTVGATERTRDAGRTDGQTDGRPEWNQYTLPPPPTTSLFGGYNSFEIEMAVINQ